MLLLINAELINPPTSPSCFRTVTFIAKLYCNYDVLLETDDNKDIYYQFLKRYGCMDFVEDIIKLGEENGIRIDVQNRYEPSFVTDRINLENQNKILKYIGFDFKFLH